VSWDCRITTRNVVELAERGVDVTFLAPNVWALEFSHRCKVHQLSESTLSSELAMAPKKSVTVARKSTVPLSGSQNTGLPSKSVDTVVGSPK
jgi:hypothetical protein